MSTIIEKCTPGDIVGLYLYNSGGAFQAPEFTSKHIIEATYLGQYNRVSGDRHLVGWKDFPDTADEYVQSHMPDLFIKNPLVPNAKEYRYSRWVGRSRVTMIIQATPIGTPTGFKLSPRHVPGWHQCKCGFRNQDISESAFIAGKYVCYQCRNIWVK